MMTVEQALRIVDRLLHRRRLKNIEELLFRQAWEGKTYAEIADESGYDASYVRDVGYKLWQDLSTAIGERVTKSNVHVVFRRLDSRWEARAVNGESSSWPSHPLPSPVKLWDWGGLLDTSPLVGREAELAQLRQWILVERRSAVGIFGMGGLGKTRLVGAFAESVRDEFDGFWCRSLRHGPLPQTLLAEWVQTFDPTTIGQEGTLDSWLSRAGQIWQSGRYLLVLDGVEGILQEGAAGRYRPECEGYGAWLRQMMGGSPSCLVLTGREQPADRVDGLATLSLGGLGNEGQALLLGAERWPAIAAAALEYYRGNPLALKVASRIVQELFDGNLAEFWQQRAGFFGSLRDLLQQQWQRLSALEVRVMYGLALSEQPLTLSELQERMVTPPARGKSLEALSSLLWRSLVEKREGRFGLPPLIAEYASELWLEECIRDLAQGDGQFFAQYDLRDSPALAALTERLGRRWGTAEAIAQRLRAIALTQGYFESNREILLSNLAPQR
ncbi:MAG: hypothetical protein ACUVSQ_08630 [Pseudanabaenaceae cyanobacterium]